MPEAAMTYSQRFSEQVPALPKLGDVALRPARFGLKPDPRLGYH